MARHGMTVKFCHHCGKYTSHAIVESPDKHVTAYACLDVNHHLDEQAYQAQAQGAD